MKTVIFDFDGTLTKKDQNVWKMLWQKLGYSTDKDSAYAKLYVDCIINKTISRQQWFDDTCDYFIQKNMTKDKFEEVNSKIEQIDGLKETIKILKKKGFRLIILSGCIVETIKSVLGDLSKYFDIIESNRAVFDKNGKLIKLVPTDCDYEGKSKFVLEYMSKTKTLAKDIFFVGNSDNDEFVYKTGVKTICINPTKFADSENKDKWHKVLTNVANLQNILPEILKDYELEETFNL